jgi:hypothetical protein
VCGAPGVSGAACTDSSQCNAPNQLVCNPTTKLCAAVALAPSGTCGLAAGGLILCTGGSDCLGIAAPKYQGTCSSVAQVGAACDTVKGPTCVPGAVCDCGGSDGGACSGTCKLKDPASCH